MVKQNDHSSSEHNGVSNMMPCKTTGIYGYNVTTEYIYNAWVNEIHLR